MSVCVCARVKRVNWLGRPPIFLLYRQTVTIKFNSTLFTIKFFQIGTRD